MEDVDFVNPVAATVFTSLSSERAYTVTTPLELAKAWEQSTHIVIKGTTGKLRMIYGNLRVH